MSLQHHVVLMLVLLVQASGFKPSNEETEPEFAPRWVKPEKMTKRLLTAGTGQTVKFRCVAAGNPAPTLSWFKNGRNIETEQRRGGFKVRDKTWTLTMTSVIPPGDGGNYTCVVQNKHGLLVHSYQLVVIMSCGSRPPVFEAGFPGNQTAVVGADVTLECRVQREKLSTYMQWMKMITVNGSRFGPDGFPYVTVLESSSLNRTVEVLTLKNVTLQDAGEYTCLAGNGVKFNFQTTWLTVIKPEPPHEPREPRERPGLLPYAMKWAFGALFG